MRILIAPDKFKGSLTAVEAASALKAGFQAVFPNAEYELVPIADGGEGTAEAFCAALGGEVIHCETVDAFGRPVDAEYVWISEKKVAVIDMSAASGLWRVAREERNPLRASTFGTGLLMADAIKRGARRIFIGLGGSATNDAGCGMAAALGWRFLDSSGKELEPFPEALEKLQGIQPPASLPDVECFGLADVKNPLLGERGASAIYGPQKGADSAMVTQLDGVLKRVADCFSSLTGKDAREKPGAGAAGGLGFGILSFLGGTVEPGFDAIADLVRLEERIATSDLVVTAEGKLDSQTLEGKGPAGVAKIAKRLGKPIYAFGGAVLHEKELGALFTASFAIANRPMSLEESEKEAFALLELAAARVARVLKYPIHE